MLTTPQVGHRNAALMMTKGETWQSLTDSKGGAAVVLDDPTAVENEYPTNKSGLISLTWIRSRMLESQCPQGKRCQLRTKPIAERNDSGAKAKRVQK